MTLTESFLPEFDAEMASTRKVLERVPEDKFGWKPHEKSFSMGELATHLSNIPQWVTFTFSTDSMDVMPGGVPLPPAPMAKTRAELLEQFDRNVAAARSVIAGATDEQALGSWSLLANGKTMFTEPRTALLRGFILNHSIHHRAQLGLYLRLTGVPVPALYGPTADEALT